MNGSIHQQTLKNSVRATGLALHTGKQVNLILGPGPVDSGIVFRRTDLKEEMSVHAHALNVGSTHMATSLTNGMLHAATEARRRAEARETRFVPATARLSFAGIVARKKGLRTRDGRFGLFRGVVILGGRADAERVGVLGVLAGLRRRAHQGGRDRRARSERLHG